VFETVAGIGEIRGISNPLIWPWPKEWPARTNNRSSRQNLNSDAVLTILIVLFINDKFSFIIPIT
jgi:hypothetical protein